MSAKVSLLVGIVGMLLVMLPTGIHPAEATFIRPTKVAFKLRDTWVNTAELDRKAREYLKQKGLPPPADSAPLFDLYPDKGAFLRVSYPRPIGQPTWHVYLSRDGKVIAFEKIILRG